MEAVQFVARSWRSSFQNGIPLTLFSLKGCFKLPRLLALFFHGFFISADGRPHEENGRESKDKILLHPVSICKHAILPFCKVMKSIRKVSSSRQKLLILMAG